MFKSGTHWSSLIFTAYLIVEMRKVEIYDLDLQYNMKLREQISSMQSTNFLLQTLKTYIFNDRL